MVAPPPSLHPSYRASSVLRGDPTSTTPSAFLASSARTGILPRRREPWISLVTVMTDRRARTGLRPRVPPHRSPFARCRVLPSVMKSTSAQSLRNKISGLDTFTAWGPPRSIGPRSLSYLRISPSVAARAARLDTGPVAGRYPGGIFPRLSCRHRQVASFSALLGCAVGTLATATMNAVKAAHVCDSDRRARQPAQRSELRLRTGSNLVAA